MKRRSFLASILASGFAPAAIGSGVLMPVRALAMPMLSGPAVGEVMIVTDLGSEHYLFVHDGEIWLPKGAMNNELIVRFRASK